MDREIDDLASRADELAAGGEWDAEAEEINRRLIELDPGRIVAYTRLAKCLREKGDPEPAEALYQRVLEQDPSNRIAANYLAGLKAEREAVADAMWMSVLRRVLVPGRASLAM